MDEQADAELSAVVKAQAVRHEAPPELRRLIGNALQQAAAAPQKAARRGAWLWPKIGLAFACGVLASVLVMQFRAAPAEEALADEVVSAHVRSLMAGHLQDVAAGDRHVVKPWFAGKLDFSPPVVDLAGDGYALAGGRLDYIDHRAVAALVYRHRAHTINVFVWPYQGSPTRPNASATQNGYNLVAWAGSGMQFWLVSDLNPEELREFAGKLRNATQ